MYKLCGCKNAPMGWSEFTNFKLKLYIHAPEKQGLFWSF